MIRRIACLRQPPLPCAKDSAQFAKREELDGASRPARPRPRTIFTRARTGSTGARKPILEPDLPIIDPHHHLWDREDWRYLLDDLLADTNSGHNIVATVFVQARAMLRADGPDEMKPVGEVEFVNGVAAMSASGIYGKIRACAGIVGHADLMLGAASSRCSPALDRAGGGRFRGIRHIVGLRCRSAGDESRQPGVGRHAG